MKTGKTKTRVHTHPDMHAPPPISIHTHTFSLLFFSLLLCPLSASTLLLPVQRIVSSGHIMSPLSLSLSLCDQWGCLHSAGSTPSLKFNINPPPPPDSTMKAGRAGRGRMSHPRVHSPQKKPSCDFFFLHVRNFKSAVLKRTFT